jgi:hypothetical protein
VLLHRSLCYIRNMHRSSRKLVLLLTVSRHWLWRSL